MEPNITVKVNTVSKNMLILRRLPRSAVVKKLISVRNSPNLKIRNTLNNRNALNTSNECAPGIKKPKYVGIKAIRSMIPSKLKTYRQGLPILTKRNTYSAVNKTV